MKDFVKTTYNKHYKNIGFERSGLFKLIKNEFNCKTVLYPGCFIHITPSFYFHHVVYIDNNEKAIAFFRQKEHVSSLISERKTYKKSGFFNFLPVNYNEDLRLRPQSYDLLISIFSGTLIHACEKYVKIGGIILSNSLFSDNESLINNKAYELVYPIVCKNRKYTIADKMDKIKKPGDSTLKRTSYGFEYVDNEIYYIYRKIQ